MHFNLMQSEELYQHVALAVLSTPLYIKILLVFLLVAVKFRYWKKKVTLNVRHEELLSIQNDVTIQTYSQIFQTM